MCFAKSLCETGSIFQPSTFNLRPLQPSTNGRALELDEFCGSLARFLIGPEEPTLRRSWHSYCRVLIDRRHVDHQLTLAPRRHQTAHHAAVGRNGPAPT